MMCPAGRHDGEPLGRVGLGGYRFEAGVQLLVDEGFHLLLVPLVCSSTLRFFG